MKRMLLSLALLALPAMGLEMRVKDHQGVAQIFQDGKPIHGRMFWGGWTGSRVTIKPGEQRMAIDRVANVDLEGRLTFHFRFDHKPANVLLDDFEVIDTVTGEAVIEPCRFTGGQAEYEQRFRQWPGPDKAGSYATAQVVEGAGPDGSPALSLNLTWEAGKKYDDFHIYTVSEPAKLVGGRKYRINLWIKSDVETTLGLVAYEPPNANNPRFTARITDGQFESQVRLAMGAGVDLISPSYGIVWPEKSGGVYNFAHLDSLIKAILKMNPNAKILLRVGMTPPDWWMLEHPDELMGWVGPQANNRMFSVSSKLWRETVCRHLGAMIDHLEATFPEGMAGYHPCGQNTGEWFYKDSWGNHHHGFSPVEIKAFRTWLSRKYGTDAALQAAWKNPTVTLSQVSVPSVERRETSPSYGIWLLPGESQDVIDFNTFLQDEMSDTVCAMAKTVREHTHGKKLSVFFYGYGYEFSVMGRPSASGHYGLRKVLECPDIDIVCSPISYTDRQQGGAAQAMTAAESVQLAHKLWLYEDDTATHLSQGNAPGWRDRVKTSYESRQLLVRNTAQEICRNIACWWMDLRQGGWFNDPAFWEDMKMLRKMEQPLLDHPRVYVPEIASVYDERSMLFVRKGGVVSRNLTCNGRAQLARTGTSYGQYLLDDLLAGKVPSKVVLLHNAWVLDTAQRAGLKRVLKDKFTIWGYAAGPLDPAKAGVQSTAVMRELCGFNVIPLGVMPAVCKVRSTVLGLGYGLPESWSLQWEADMPPMLYGVQPLGADKVLATWPDGTPAVVMGPQGIFCGIPSVPHELLRVAAKAAGVRLLTDDDCALFCQEPYVMVHANHDGPVTLSFETAKTITDVMTGTVLGTGVKTVTLPMKFAETRVISAK